MKREHMNVALDHSDIWHRAQFQNPKEELEGEELTRNLTIVHSAMNAYEALYSEYLAGTVEQAFWEAKVPQIGWVIARLRVVVAAPWRSSSRVWSEIGSL